MTASASYGRRGSPGRHGADSCCPTSPRTSPRTRACRARRAGWRTPCTTRTASSTAPAGGGPPRTKSTGPPSPSPRPSAPVARRGSWTRTGSWRSCRPGWAAARPGRVYVQQGRPDSITAPAPVRGPRHPRAPQQPKPNPGPPET